MDYYSDSKPTVNKRGFFFFLLGTLAGLALAFLLHALALPNDPPAWTTVPRAARLTERDCTNPMVLRVVRAMNDSSSWHTVLDDTDWIESKKHNVTVYKNSIFNEELNIGPYGAKPTKITEPDVSPICRWVLNKNYNLLAKSLTIPDDLEHQYSQSDIGTE